MKLLDILDGGYIGAIKAFVVVGAIVAVIGYIFHGGIMHERKAWTDKQLVEAVAQQKLEIAARDIALESQRMTARAAAANQARRDNETQSLKVTIEKLKTKPSPCKLDDATRSLLNDYAAGKAAATDPATDNH